ncbi:hypothetical protein [Pseudomonas savastanoi]|uniref:hypothetical protein n=1 Tax=Pseudomonas savastanoi TaxID=29438 RepID=UPI001E62BF7D|nr:hypothetical protein [Pseudomonas savastanoi]
MTTEKVFAKSDTKDMLALSEVSAEAILDNCTTTIVLAAAKTDVSDEQETRSEWECQFAEPEDIPAAALEYLLTTGGDAQEMRSEDQANLEQHSNGDVSRKLSN